MQQPTRASLLVRIKNRDDVEAWRQFYELYSPLLARYAAARGLSREDIEDVQATCYEAIVRQIQDFEYDPARGRFKSWLKTLVSRRVADLLRRRRERHLRSEALRQVQDGGEGPDEVWEQHWKQQHLKYCVDLIRGEVSPQTFKIFTLLVLKNQDVNDVCAALGVTPNLAYKARQRVLERVREKMREIGYDDVEA